MKIILFCVLLFYTDAVIRETRQNLRQTQGGYSQDLDTCKEYNDNLKTMWGSLSKYINSSDLISETALHNIAVIIKAYLDHQNKESQQIIKETKQNRKKNVKSDKICEVLEKVTRLLGKDNAEENISKLIFENIKPKYSDDNCKEINENNIIRSLAKSYKSYVESIKCPNNDDLALRQNKELLAPSKKDIILKSDFYDINDLDKHSTPSENISKATSKEITKEIVHRHENNDPNDDHNKSDKRRDDQTRKSFNTQKVNTCMKKATRHFLASMRRNIERYLGLYVCHHDETLRTSQNNPQDKDNVAATHISTEYFKSNKRNKYSQRKLSNNPSYFRKNQNYKIAKQVHVNNDDMQLLKIIRYQPNNKHYTFFEMQDYNPVTKDVINKNIDDKKTLVDLLSSEDTPGDKTEQEDYLENNYSDYEDKTPIKEVKVNNRPNINNKQHLMESRNKIIDVIEALGQKYGDNRVKKVNDDENYNVQDLINNAISLITNLDKNNTNIESNEDNEGSLRPNLNENKETAQGYENNTMFKYWNPLRDENTSKLWSSIKTTSSLEKEYINSVDELILDDNADRYSAVIIMKPDENSEDMFSTENELENINGFIEKSDEAKENFEVDKELLINQIPILLRKKPRKSCLNTGAKVCTNACKAAYKDACAYQECDKKLKKELKKQCKRSCKSHFLD